MQCCVSFYPGILLTVLLMTNDNVVQAAEVDAYEAHTFEATEGILHYRLLKPADYSKAKSYPLVLFLHGAGERGDDNRSQLKHVVGRFAEAEVQAKYPCFVVVPQCPAGQLWCNTPWNVDSVVYPDEPSAAMEKTMSLLKEVQKQYSVDADRIYVMGLSMGGFGTWDAVSRYPGKFAAAVPMCGGGDVRKADVLAKTPIWNFHGARDMAVRVKLSRDLIAAIREAGGQPRYTEYPEAGHDCWTPAMKEPDLLPWLFTQRRAAASPSRQ